MLATGSCGSTRKDSVVASPADTETPAKQEVISGVAIIPDSIGENAEYLSDDLRLFGLHGPVHNVAVIGDNTGFVSCLTKTLVFNPDGSLATGFAEFTDNMIEKGDDGILRATSTRDAAGHMCRLEFTRLNAKGQPLDAVYTAKGPGYEVNATVSYDYEQYDDFGNWTRRSLNGAVIKKEGERADTTLLCNAQTRTYTYY